jgi:hypothetical protein
MWQWNDNPFRYAVLDQACDPALVREAAKSFDEVPADNWYQYNSVLERKRTTRKLTLAAYVLLRWLRNLCPPELVSDDSLHGGGMHELLPGGWLGCHLDCDTHPVTGYRRAVNAILYLTAAEGGALELWKSPDDPEPAVEIAPQAGRLVIFETSDVSWHGVAPVQGTVSRRSLACYWWEPVLTETRRPRALFANRSGDPDVAQLIKERAQ